MALATTASALSFSIRSAGTFEDWIGTDALGNKFRPQARELQLGPDNPIWRFPGVAAVLEGAESYYTADATADCPPDLLYLFDGSPRDNLVVALRAGQAVVGMISVDNLITGRPHRGDRMPDPYSRWLIKWGWPWSGLARSRPCAPAKPVWPSNLPPRGF